MKNKNTPQIVASEDEIRIHNLPDFSDLEKKAGAITGKNVDFVSINSLVIFSKDEIIKEDKHPYVVFTPYSRKWKEAFEPDKIPRFLTHDLNKNYLQTESSENSISLESLGYRTTNIRFPETTIPDKLLLEYGRLRDYLAKDGTSHLGVHLRFGI